MDRVTEAVAALSARVDHAAGVLQWNRRRFEECSQQVQNIAALQLQCKQLSIGGVRVHLSEQSILRCPDSMLAAMFSGPFDLSPDCEGVVFIDRDGSRFDTLAAFLREGDIQLPATREETHALVQEAAFFGIDEVQRQAQRALAHPTVPGTVGVLSPTPIVFGEPPPPEMCLLACGPNFRRCCHFPNGNVAAIESRRHMAHIYSDDGRLLRTIPGSDPLGPSGFLLPVGIACSANGLLAISDAKERNVQLFRENGEPFLEFSTGDHDPAWVAFDASDNLVIFDDHKGQGITIRQDGTVIKETTIPIIDEYLYFDVCYDRPRQQVVVAPQCLGESIYVCQYGGGLLYTIQPPRYGFEAGDAVKALAVDAEGKLVAIIHDVVRDTMHLTVLHHNGIRCADFRILENCRGLRNASVGVSIDADGNVVVACGDHLYKYANAK